MNIKRVGGIILLVCGIGLLFFSHHISERVAEGRVEIAEGQKKVDTADSLFSLNPYSKQVGKEVTGSGQKKINEGSKEADEYSVLAGRLQIAGVISLVLGAGLFLISFRKK
jgi:hypothetical protein